MPVVLAGLHHFNCNWNRSLICAMARPAGLLALTAPWIRANRSLSFSLAATSAASRGQSMASYALALAWLSGIRAMNLACTSLGAPCFAISCKNGCQPIGLFLSAAKASRASQSCAVAKARSLTQYQRASGMANDLRKPAAALAWPSRSAVMMVSARLRPTNRACPVSRSRRSCSLRRTAASAAARDCQALSRFWPYFCDASCRVLMHLLTAAASGCVPPILAVLLHCSALCNARSAASLCSCWVTYRVSNSSGSLTFVNLTNRFLAVALGATSFQNSGKGRLR
eukprot:GHRR01015500.1.p1 GENE.GHRR01015500.1~~GHRR01015500.1.p1  ORF type:complete len:284 (-),score=43.79 GHRR01015500.1:510-1361(-)